MIMKNLIRPHFQQLLKYGLIFMLCIACTSVFAVTLEKRISTGNDDAEQTADGKMDRSSSDIELVFDDGNQTVGLRFDNLGIPNGATIEQAYIQFNVDESNTNAASLEIRGEAVDSATIFTSDYFNISNRRTTSNMISWEPVAWNTVHAQGGDQRTPDLRDVIQEIINRNGWQSGNALAIIITGSGERTAESYEGDQTKAPQLYIEYTISSEPPEPEATPEPEQIETPEAVAVCSDTATAKVYLVGDSTVDSDSGWGDSLIDYLSSGSVVVNEAAGGRSSKSFYEEGLFDIVRANLEEGDYVLIQFGHNDSKSDSKLYTTPGSSPDYEGTYRDYLELYVDETRTTGGIPIIVTSVNRMDFDSEYSLNMTLGEYPAAARKAALDFGAVMLDLEKESAEIFNSLGEEETLSLYSDGSSKTHFPSDKSFRVAKMVADLIGESSSSLRCSLANYNPTTEPEVTPEPESEVSPAPETEVTPDPEPEVTPEPEPEVTPEPEPEVTPAPEEGFIITLQRTVSASAEDIEEEGNGKMDFSSSDLELGSYPNPNDQQTVAIRFTDLSIPSNANITKAYIQFKVDEKSSGNAKIDIYGEY
ncbi:GDSL-type esterase/lipase family protein, partial [Psychromonas sp.]|uniref:GDSL-type esterase/lipase family protein n=1 Tax=Psychromonas sp. TaxID=1884585 RepID=UPI00356947E5